MSGKLLYLKHTHNTCTQIGAPTQHTYISSYHNHTTFCSDLCSCPMMSLYSSGRRACTYL